MPKFLSTIFVLIYLCLAVFVKPAESFISQNQVLYTPASAGISAENNKIIVYDDINQYHAIVQNGKIEINNGNKKQNYDFYSALNNFKLKTAFDYPFYRKNIIYKEYSEYGFCKNIHNYLVPRAP